jgi:hypothetical protein
MVQKGRFTIEPTPDSFILFNKLWYEEKKKPAKKGRFSLTPEPVRIVSVKANKPKKKVYKKGRFTIESSSWKN